MNYDEILLSPAVKFLPDKSCLSTREYGDIHLTPNEQHLLELIISGRSKKDIIFEEIWYSQGIVVSESSYYQLIKMLRRKLESAGLPGSIIKTIPRYGIVLDPDETINEESANNEPTRQGAGTDVVQSDDSKVKPHLFSSFSGRLLLIFGATAMLLPPLCVPLLMRNAPAFPDSIVVDGITFHFSSTRILDHTEMAKKRQELPDGVDNVYIASNGPKVFIARCEGKISEDGICSYEYYSSY
ncbi:helix-turn-helix domain-containing protein (plasmid) [Enterobacter bugandensis]|uniref:winged helix-turn-helix domain-containing protein n=1 Tax=Enterobacter bugandensis TaxID=881260 RepID=UPI00283A9F8E|nr:helix-turn-helix domain-containing protein [Enterobacter bugandensis]WMU75315.1 helix-turn-helix domain-containing protein [Enterobacter bugandensis]